MKTKIISRVLTAILSIIVAGIVFFYFSPDYNMFIVRSESMVPAINMGDMVITGPVNGPFSGNVKEGTIITYDHGNQFVTHRILSINGETITTKGDAVEDPDAFTITSANIKGIYLFKVPSLGYVTKFIQTRVGWLIAVVIPSVVLLVLLFRSVNKELKKRVTEKKTARDKEVIATIENNNQTYRTWKQEKGHYLK